ncbi:MAG TPA: NADH-quinone oxidoreductase subunit N [Candidatus Bathyarchaeia archaeon]|nr:NADH-quinone oxidoreductase subunit N [Candidatus Bathyarchaeia archaeon]
MDLTTSILLFTLPIFAILMPLIQGVGNRIHKRLLVAYWSILGLVVSLCGVMLLISEGVPQPHLVYGVLSVDSFSVYFTAVFVLITLLVSVASLSYMRDSKNLDTYFGLLLFATFGMMLIAFSVDLITLFLAWELMNVPTYVLTGFRKNDSISNEAALKFFIMSALSSALIIYGISLTFGITGSTNLYVVASGLGMALPKLEPLALLAMVLFIAGFGMKVAAVPFHMWIPDAYEGAPITVGAFLAAGTKNGGFAALLRVFVIAMIALKLDWAAAFAVIAILTMTLGNIAAMTQKSFTRMLAYSSIAQAGYILIGFAAPNPLGLVGALFHILNHGVMKTAAFTAAAAVYSKLSTTNLDSYSGLAKRMPITAFTLTIALFALAGVPPLSGFMSKLVLFTAAVDGQLWWLALAGVLNSAFSMAYYGWVVKRMYFDEPSVSTRLKEPVPLVAVLVVCTILIIVIGLYPGPILNYLYQVARYLSPGITGLAG